MVGAVDNGGAGECLIAEDISHPDLHASRAITAKRDVGICSFSFFISNWFGVWVYVITDTEMGHL